MFGNDLDSVPWIVSSLKISTSPASSNAVNQITNMSVRSRNCGSFNASSFAEKIA